MIFRIVLPMLMQLLNWCVGDIKIDISKAQPIIDFIGRISSWFFEFCGDDWFYVFVELVELDLVLTCTVGLFKTIRSYFIKI